MTTNYPTALDSTTNFPNGSNNYATTLTGAIDSVVTTIPVVSTTGLVAPCIFTIGTEIIFAATQTSTTFTGCVRGYESSIAVSHVSGANVDSFTTYGSFSGPRSALFAIEGLLGTNASQTHPIANTAFLGTSASASSWAQITNAYVDPNAAIAATKLAAMTVSRAVVSDGSGFISPSSVTSTELGYVSGVTSAIQTQLGTKIQSNQPRATIIGTTATTMNNPRDVAVVGKIAYVTDFGNNHINIYNVSVPSSPTLISTITDADLNAPRQMAIQGKYLYVSNQSGNSFTVFDITNPKSPSKLVTKSGGSIASPGGIYVVGKYLYLTGGQVGAQLTVFDNTNPAVPVELGTYTPPSGEKFGRGVFQSKYGYFTLQSSTPPFTDDGLYIIDLSNPASPSLVGRYLVSGIGTTGAPVDCSIIGNIVYEMDEGGGIRVIDVTDPTTPTQIGYTTTGIAGGSTGIWAQGRYVYASSQINNTVVAYDVIDPTNPTVVATSAGTLNTPSKLTVVGRYLYVVNRSGGGPGGSMSIIDLGQDDVAQIKAGAVQADFMAATNGFRAGYASIDGDFFVGRTAQIGDNFSVNGNVAIHGTITSGTWNGTAIGDAFISSAATWNAKQNALVNSAGLAAALSDETGTGLAVFGTNPTLTAPTIAKLANLTTNGMLYTSGGDGTLNAAANVTTDGNALIVTNNANAVFSQFGQTPSVSGPGTGQDNLYAGMVSNATSGNKIAFSALSEFTGTSNSTSLFAGSNAVAQTSGTSTANLTTVTVPGGLANRFQVNHIGSGAVTLAAAISARIRASGGNAGLITDSADFNAETPTMNAGTTWNSFAGLWVRGGAVAGTLTTRYGVRVDTLTGGSTLWGLWLQTDNAFVGGILSAGSGSTALTDSTGKILSAALNTVGVAQGGTGQTAYTDGQLLIGNTATGLLSKATLTQGANITITNGNGTITIAGAAAVSGANPTATVGTSVVNGSAGTFLRSDGAPAIDQTMSPTWTGVHIFNPAARTSGSAPYFKITTAPDTTLAATVEAPGFQVVSATRQWATGAITEQREHILNGPTYAFVGASTITRAANLYASSPIVGTNATLTKSFGALFESSAAAHIPLALRMAATPSGDAFEVLSSANAVLARIDSAGAVYGSAEATDSMSFVFQGQTRTGWRGFNNNIIAVTNAVTPIYITSTTFEVANGVIIGFETSTPTSALVAGITKNASGVLEINNGTAGQWGSLLTGTRDGGTTTVVTGLSIGHQSTGTPAAGFGTALLLNANSSTTADQNQCQIYSAWKVATHASRESYAGIKGVSGGQTLVDRMLVGPSLILANNTATAIMNATLASNTITSGLVSYTVEVFDGTNLQVETGEFVYVTTNKAGAFANNTITFATGWPKNVVTSGTLVCTWTITAANPAVLTLNANSSLTPSAGYPRVTYNVRNQTQQVVAVQ